MEENIELEQGSQNDETDVADDQNEAGFAVQAPLVQRDGEVEDEDGGQQHYDTVNDSFRVDDDEFAVFGVLGRHQRFDHPRQSHANHLIESVGTDSAADAHLAVTFFKSSLGQVFLTCQNR